MRRKSNTFLDLLEYYVNIYLPTSRGLSVSTITSYKAVFRILMEFMYSKKGISASQICFDLLTTSTIMEFLDWIETTRSCSITTRNHRL